MVIPKLKRTDKATNEVMEYSWDIRDRLAVIIVKNALGEIIRTAQYTYGVYNQRIVKVVDADGDGSLAAVTERFVYGSDQNIALVFDENGNVNHRYLFGNGVDQIEADESNGNVLWALTDHLGSFRDVVDNSGTVLNHIVYDAFGGVTSQTDESVVFRYGYTAREFDAESGLQYNRARYLDSFTGRFISEDPISFQGGDSNLYRYVRNFSTILLDPSGLQAASDEIPNTSRIAFPDLGSIFQGIGNGISEIGKAFERALVPPAEAPTFPSNPQASKKGDPKPRPRSDEQPFRYPEPKTPPFNPNICKPCITRELDYHLGGNPKRSYYATYTSGSKGDFFIQSPDGRSTYFDGLVISSGELHIQKEVTTYKSVIEAKAWNWGGYNDSLKLLTSTRLISDVLHDQIVAKQCGYTYSVFVSSPSLYNDVKNYVAAPLYLVPFKWGKFDT